MLPQYSTARQSFVINVLKRAVTACRGTWGAAGADDFRDIDDSSSSSSSADPDQDKEKKKDQDKEKKKKKKDEKEKKKKEEEDDNDQNSPKPLYFNKDLSAEFNNSLLWQTMLYVAQANIQ